VSVGRLEWTHVHVWRGCVPSRNFQRLPCSFFPLIEPSMLSLIPWPCRAEGPSSSERAPSQAPVTAGPPASPRSGASHTTSSGPSAFLPQISGQSRGAQGGSFPSFSVSSSPVKRQPAGGFKIGSAQRTAREGL
jgi:hypothetical protein